MNYSLPHSMASASSGLSMKTRETIKGILRGLADTSESAFYDDATWLSGANQGTSWWQSLVSTFNLIRHLIGRKTLGLLLIGRAGFSYFYRKSLIYTLLAVEKFHLFSRVTWVIVKPRAVPRQTVKASFFCADYLSSAFLRNCSKLCCRFACLLFIVDDTALLRSYH